MYTGKLQSCDCDPAMMVGCSLQLGKVVMYCDARWPCNNIVVVGNTRYVAGTRMCRACYQHVWDVSKKLGTTIIETYQTCEAPWRFPPNVGVRCARVGCGRELPEGKPRRHVGGFIHLCRTCYQSAWELSKKLDLSVEEAYHKLLPKGWVPPPLMPPKEVRCAMPWCGKSTLPELHKAFGSGTSYVCNQCLQYLKRYAERFKNKKVWQEMARDVPAPGSHEQCVMSWCGRQRKPKNYGPGGEMLCQADVVYLHLYAQRHGTTFADAFHHAPPPRRNGRPRRP